MCGKLVRLVAVLLGASAITVAAGDAAFAWQDQVTVEVNGCVVVISASGLTWEGKPSDHIEWQIFAAPHTDGAEAVAEGQLLPSPDNPDVAVPVTLEGDQVLPPGDYVLKWWLFIPGKDRPEGGDAPVAFTVDVCEQPPTDEPSETPTTPSEPPGDEPPAEQPPAEQPPVDQGSTLPKTGSGFPTATAAAFAVFLVSVGGFLLTWRRGSLPIPYRPQH